MAGIITGFLIGVAATVAFAASRKPNEFRVSRSALINGPAAAVFEQVNDLEKWKAWSPWERMDPDARSTFESTHKAGTGAKVAWEGKKTGKGSMTITESRPHEFISFKLEFLKPMKSTSTTAFTFAPEGGKTRVTWTMAGPNKFMGKVMSVFMDCSSMVGQQFEDGLRYLNEVVEQQKKAA